MPGPADDTLKQLTEEALIQKLMAEVQTMEESVTYQMILRQGKAEGKAEGKTEEARRMLLLFGSTNLGEPSPEV